MKYLVLQSFVSNDTVGTKNGYVTIQNEEFAKSLIDAKIISKVGNKETNKEKAPAMSYFEAMAKEYVKEDSKKLAELGSRLFRFKKAYESIDSKQNALKKKIEAIRYEI